MTRFQAFGWWVASLLLAMALMGAATDSFQNHSKSINQPVTGAITVTQSDTAELSHVTRWIRLNAAGELKVTLQDGTIMEGLDVLPGDQLPLRVKQVWNTGTTLADADIHAGY